jgi:radical SAM family RiPP maturation amino acid epimerase
LTRPKQSNRQCLVSSGSRSTFLIVIEVLIFSPPPVFLRDRNSLLNQCQRYSLADRIAGAGLAPPAPEDITPFADIKRFHERWIADSAFRASFRCDPARTGSLFGLRANPEEMRPFWDPLASAAIKRREAQHAPVVRRFLDFIEQLGRHRNHETTNTQPADPRFAQWRTRQVYRLNLEVGTALSQNPHIVASYELSRGCSVGCWFCSASPPTLGDVFRHTPENARLWREVLESTRDVIGPAPTSICYYGTDPFDNPDYERFTQDFSVVHGAVPYTSTALPVRDVERTRRLIAQSGPNRLRFSLLSVGMLNKIHTAFTPEEMLLVDVAPRNEGSTQSHLMNFAGRAREHIKTYQRHHSGEPLIDTPSCRSGFLFNLVDRVIRLSTPCAPDDRWPNGERVYEEAHFQDGMDVRRILEGMIARHMATEPGEQMVLRFQRSLQFEATAQGFNLNSRYLRQRFEDTSRTPFMGRLGAMIDSGRHTAEQVVEILGPGCADTLSHLFRLGLLNDEPVVAGSGSLVAIKSMAMPGTSGELQGPSPGNFRDRPLCTRSAKPVKRGAVIGGITPDTRRCRRQS